MRTAWQVPVKRQGAGANADPVLPSKTRAFTYIQAAKEAFGAAARRLHAAESRDVANNMTGIKSDKQAPFWILSGPRFLPNEPPERVTWKC